MKKSLLLIPLILLSASCVFEKVNIRAEAHQAVLQKNDGQKLLFTKAQKALDTAAPGDIVLLGPGRHQGPLVFKSSGVTLKGEKYAFVSAMDSSWRPVWQKAPSYGKYTWSSRIPFKTKNVSIDGRVMLNIPENAGNDARMSFYKSGFGTDGREVLRRMFTYLDKYKLVLVSFPGNAKPGQHRIEAALENSSAILISGVDGCTVENLIIQCGDSGVKLENTNGSIVKNCLITGNNCIVLGENTRNCKILANDLTLTPDFLNTFRASAGNDPWYAASLTGEKDKWAVLAQNPGNDNEIANNYIYNAYRGIGQFAGSTLNFHNNRIDLCADKALAIADPKPAENFITRSRFSENNAIPSVAVPSGPVSGLWEVADDFLPLYEMRLSEFYPEYRRIIRAGKDGIIEFYATGIPDVYDLMRIKLVRFPPNTSDGYSIKVFSEKGGLLLAKKGTPAKYIGPSELSLDFPPEKNKRLKVVINDAPGSEWYFPKSKFFTPALSAKKQTRLVKYDDQNPYKLFYDIPTWTDSIYIFMDPLHEGAYASIENHNIKTVLKKSGTLKVPYPGRCTIRLFFKEEMTFSIDGPSDTILIAPDQEMERFESE